jgi:hypothetical protein
MADPGKPWGRRGYVRSGGDDPPARYVESGTWPDVVLRVDAPLSAYGGLIVARRLITVLDLTGRTANAVAVQAGVTAPTVRGIISGVTTVSLPTILRLESALETRLYPLDLFRVSAAELRDIDLDERFPLTGPFLAGPSKS